MATLTRNLFRGQGEQDHRLDVIEGTWPDDVEGAVFVIGPDKREPGGHWFDSHGLLCRIDLAPDDAGRIGVRHRRVRTPVERLRRRFPKLFRLQGFIEVSPFGVTNMANTNVLAIDGRLFIGYDAGRPVEVDPDTLEYLTPVGANDEWFQAAPGLVEPLVSVAAHPAAAFDERALYFVNYSPLPGSPTFLARWGLSGPIERWPLDGMGAFDSIHDIKATDDYLVFTDLPFVVEPATLRGEPRTRANQDHTRLWIVRKHDLRTTPPGDPVPVRQIDLPMPTGHLSVGTANPDGVLTVNLEHIPLADLMITLDPTTRDHRRGAAVDPEYEGLVSVCPQPVVVGRYRIDAETGTVHEEQLVWDDRFWGSVLITRDESTPAARARVDELWYAGMGFDPDLVPDEWWRLYGDGANTHLVDPDQLPDTAQPGGLARFDLASGKVADLYTYDAGAFPSPPTFVPRRGAEDPGDGYVVVVVHQDGAKEIQIFDAHDLGRGPLARASAPTFNPNLLLHSYWMAPRPGPRPSAYRVPLRRDVAGAVAGMPRALAGIVRGGKAMQDAAKA